jgi:hypothetical protein
MVDAVDGFLTELEAASTRGAAAPSAASGVGGP